MSEDFEIDEEGYRVRKKGDAFSPQPLHDSDDSDEDGEEGTRQKKRLEIVIKESPVPTLAPPAESDQHQHQQRQQHWLFVVETVQILQVSAFPSLSLFCSLHPGCFNY